MEKLVGHPRHSLGQGIVCKDLQQVALPHSGTSRYLAISRESFFLCKKGVFQCHLGAEARNATKHSIMHKTAPINKIIFFLRKQCSGPKC